MNTQIVKQRLKSKTYWLGTFILLLGFVQDNFPLISQYLGEHQGAVKVLIGLLIIAMRELTKEPLSEKSKPK